MLQSSALRPLARGAQGSQLFAFWVLVASQPSFAVARFDQVLDVSDEERALAFVKIDKTSKHRVERYT